MSVKVDRVLEEEYELSVLARATDYDCWMIVQKVVTAELERLEVEMRDHPMLCDDDLKRDLRSQLSAQTALKWVVSLPQEAHDSICQKR